MYNQHYADIEEQFNEIFRRKPSINFVYLSIGSKQNRSSVRLTPESATVYTNSDMQMLPVFMRHINTDRSVPIEMLITIWDVFETEESVERNRDLLDKLRKPFPHIHYIIMNKICVKNDLDRFIPFLMRKVIDHQISPSNFMIANYVRFKNAPNTLERISEMMIPTTIQEIIDRTEFKEYENSFYQWFGYNQYLYDFIYCYKQLHLNVIQSRDIYAIERLVCSEYLNSSGKTMVIQDKNVIHIMSNMFDIAKTCRLPSEPPVCTQSIGYHIMSLFETLTSANTITIPRI